MSGENLKIQSQVVPLAPRNFEKTTRTRGQKTFELDEKRFPIQERDNSGRKETDDFRPGVAGSSKRFNSVSTTRGS